MEANEHTSKTTHMDKSWWDEKLTRSKRVDARTAIQGMAQGPRLLSYERERLAAEGEEPDSLRGLL